MQFRKVWVLAFAIALCAGVMPAAAQITTGTVTGTVKDSQGGVIPGATVVLISEARGTKLAPVVTNESGDFVVPNVTADVYTVEVTMDSFKTVKRQGIRVSGGDRVGVPAITLEAGALAETVNVTAEAMLVQSQSAERSFAIDQVQIENLPIAHGNFANLTAFTPGVIQSGRGADQSGQAASRLGGAGQNNVMMDGISAMDTGNNGQMLTMNIESIGEVKVLTQGYQAEYGRSSGLQITAVTKSGTNRFRGSGYTLLTDSDWNTNSWVNQKNGDPKPKSETKTYGYTIGGPIGKPGGSNKLFFFYAHEYRPSTTAINNGNPIRLKVPTQAERNGDFSQTVDNNGAAFTNIRDFQSGQNFPGAVIPQDRLYKPGLALLNRYPLPNRTQTAGTNYNYEVAAPSYDNLLQQPAIRIDYQVSGNLRLTGKYSGERQRVIQRPGRIAGFSDVLQPYPFITNYAFTANYTVNPTTFIEATYGMIRNELADGNEGGIPVNDAANRLSALADFPLIYKDAGYVNPDYYAFEVLQDVKPAFWDGSKMNLPPLFNWGSRVVGGDGTCGASGPTCQRYPGWLNINRTQDVAVSLTKVAGRHTFKAGFYNNHSFKAQNTGVSFQGTVSFANDTNNLLDTGYGYANAALGVFTQYTQARDFIEGSMIYNNTEFYMQDNWKANNRLTLDYGVRFTHQQPQYDQFQQMSNFFPEQWTKANAPVLYVAGMLNGVRNAMDPRTGQILTAPGAANTAAAIGTPIPGTGDPLNGIKRAGDGIAKTGYTWPAIVVGPRFGMAYDISGDQTTVIRAGGGLFYDRPDGNTVFGIPNNPPITTSADLRNGQLATLGQGLSFLPVPGLQTIQYEADIPAQWHWQAGVQRALPWSMVADVSYVGNHGFNRFSVFQNGTPTNLNAVDFGAAYLPQNQDPTISSTVPGAGAYTTNLLRAYAGLGNVNQQTSDFWDTYHSIQTSFTRRFRNGFSFGANYTYGISFQGTTGLVKRLQHAPDGTVSVRGDQAQYEDLMSDLDRRPHYLKANAVWDLPNVNRFGKVVGALLNDWNVAGVLTAGSGATYDLSYSYNANGGSVNLTGSPDYGARIVFTGDPGKGCTGNQYAQFNVATVTGPTFNSVGLESGRNVMRGCPDHTVDLSLSRDIRVGGNRRVQLRVDAFNAFNSVIYDNRQGQIQFNSPTDLTIRNSQYVNGQLDPTRLQPRNAGFGAATRALAMRTVNVYARFSF
jgi:carboxypeptidase family protein/TonB-dependent receptor-like protein